MAGRIGTLITLLCLTTVAYGTSNSPMPYLHINSDQLAFNKAKNEATFTGEVIVWFDDMVLKTTNLEIIYKQINNKNEIDKIIIPTKVIAKNKEDSRVLIADYAEYFASKAELVLTGNVQLEYQDNILKTDKLVYYTKIKQINQVTPSKGKRLRD
jgi:lipopolysaccharide export system protein LptA